MIVYPLMRYLAWVVLLFALAGCKGPPARLVAGIADTVVVNNVVPVQMPMHVFDAAGRVLPEAGVRFQWTSGAPIPVSDRGVVRCTQAGDATLRASLGPLVTQVVVRCRPVRGVLGGGALNLVVGDSSPALSFAPIDAAGRPVTLFTVQVAYDTTVVSVERWRVHGRGPGRTFVSISVGDSSTFWFVQVYERAQSLEGMRPGQRLAVPVRLAGGEMHSVQLPPSPPTYFVAMLPDRDTLRVPRLAIERANCLRSHFPDGYACYALPGASVIAYHPKQDHPKEAWSGSIAVFREVRP